MTVTPLARRLTRLEARLIRDEARLPWAEVHAALRRQGARARLVIGARLGLDASHPCLADASALLVGDDPARRAADDELTACWRRAQGMAEAPGAARQRLVQRLEAMARLPTIKRPEETIGDREGPSFCGAL